MDECAKIGPRLPGDAKSCTEMGPAVVVHALPSLPPVLDLGHLRGPFTNASTAAEPATVDRLPRETFEYPQKIG